MTKEYTDPLMYKTVLHMPIIFTKKHTEYFYVLTNHHMLILRSKPQHLQEQLRGPKVESLSHHAVLALPRPEESFKLLHHTISSSLRYL